MNTPTFNSRRSPVHGKGGIVATSQPLATAAGLEILAQGGNAAVAAGAALNVTEPTSTGIGGDMFALFYSADTKRVTALNGSGCAPARLTLATLKKDGFATELPPLYRTRSQIELFLKVESSICDRGYYIIDDAQRTSTPLQQVL